MSAAVEVRDLFRIYSTPEGDAAALQGLSLTVEQGEVVAVLGPSGAGKTTLLRIVAGLERPSAGRVAVFGADLGRLSGRSLDAYRTSLGYADQHYDRALFPELTARELVALPLELRGFGPAARLARAEELLERVGLLGSAAARPRELSGGELQRVALCAALAPRPRLLLADEPTGELDAANAERVFTLIGGLAREQRCTTVIVSHDRASARIADRSVHIRDGRFSEETAGADPDGGAIVVGRGGWLRLPEEYLERAGIRSRARARLEDGAIRVVAAEHAGEPRELPPARPEVMPVTVITASQPGPVVEVRALAKAYRGAEHALAPLTASFERGALHAVTGPSGSGKTTLLRLVAGLEPPTAGEAKVLGTNVWELDRGGRAELRRRWISLVDQQPRLVHFLSAAENVRLGLAVRRRPTAADRELALRALAAVGLAERSRQRVTRLSAGERVRVAVARAIAGSTPLLLADEPTARLDAANALEVAALLARLAEEAGICVVCATHDPLVIEQAATRLDLGQTQLAALTAPRRAVRVRR